MSDDERAPVPPAANTESSSQRFARELLEILNELRLALPGVQLLFGFMLVAPFSDRFPQLGDMQRGVFFVGFVAVAMASALLIAPSVYHRLHWRREIEDKELMLRTFTWMTISGASFLALSMTSVTYVVASFVLAGSPRFGGWLPLVVTTGVAAMFLGLWFLLPLSQRLGARKKRPIARVSGGDDRHG